MFAKSAWQMPYVEDKLHEVAHDTRQKLRGGRRGPHLLTYLASYY
jgi:hypothetical protein